jgi:hypothetical protein
VGEQTPADDAGVRQTGQQQRISPGQDTDRHPRQCAACAPPPPDQTAEEGGCELRNGSKRQKTDRGELRIASQAVVHISKEEDDEDRHSAHDEQQAPDIVAPRDQGFASLQHERNDNVIRHHNGERDRFDNHHGGSRRKPADKSGNSEQVGMRGKRQRQNEHVAIDLPRCEREQAGQCDRYNEQVDHDEIEREQPGGPSDLSLAIVLDDGDVELTRQQYDGEQR